MTMAKIQNGIVEVFKDSYVKNEETGKTHSNPTEAQLRECGYKEFIMYEDSAIEEKDGYCVVPSYEETNTQIIATPTYVEIAGDVE